MTNKTISKKDQPKASDNLSPQQLKKFEAMKAKYNQMTGPEKIQYCLQDAHNLSNELSMFGRSIALLISELKALIEDGYTN